MDQINTLFQELAARAATQGYLTIDADLTKVLEVAVAKLERPKAPRKTTRAAQRHISFVLRQQAVERAYASVGR